MNHLDGAVGANPAHPTAATPCFTSLSCASSWAWGVCVGGVVCGGGAFVSARISLPHVVFDGRRPLGLLCPGALAHVVLPLEHRARMEGASFVATSTGEGGFRSLCVLPSLHCFSDVSPCLLIIYPFCSLDHHTRCCASTRGLRLFLAALSRLVMPESIMLFPTLLFIF